jgi:hypothetical protein
MAISDDVPGLQTGVLVDGWPLREYEDDEAEPDIISKFIEASSDKDFVIKWKFSHPFPVHHGVEARVQVDGERCCVEVRQPYELHKPQGHCKYGVSHMENGQWFRRNYRFTALDISKTSNLSLHVSMLMLAKKRKLPAL